jgi:hypothetical protein
MAINLSLSPRFSNDIQFLQRQTEAVLSKMTRKSYLNPTQIFNYHQSEREGHFQWIIVNAARE